MNEAVSKALMARKRRR